MRWVLKLAGISLLALILWLSLPSKFITHPYLISHDTHTYTNAPGISEGFSLNNFSNSLRTPGYPLFLFVVTLGEIPHPDTIIRVLCGADYFSKNSDCDKAAAQLNADVTVKLSPLVYGLSQRTSELFQRAITTSRFLFVFSLLMLFLSLTERSNVLLALLSVVFVTNSMRLTEFTLFQDVVATESLFPAIFFLYIAAILTYLNSGRAAWALLATLLALFSGLVRPALLYLPILHLVIVLPVAVYRREWIFAALGLLLTSAMFSWLFWWSPVTYFSATSYENDLLRTAVISDQATIDCVSDPSEKALLTAYLRSINGATSAKRSDGVERYYVQRYFDFALANSYRIDNFAVADSLGIAGKEHPIYQEPGLALRDGQIPTELIHRMLRSAKACNVGKTIEFTAIKLAMMLGLTPDLSPVHAPRFFFRSPWVFVESVLLILSAMGVAIVNRDGWRLGAISISPAIYFGTILIVAFEQGGEARYSYIVEPLFVFSAAVSASYLIEKWLTRGRHHSLFGRRVRVLRPQTPLS